MNSNSNIIDVVALMLGVISIPLACLWAVFGVIAGLAGVIVSLIGKRSHKSVMLTAALITSLIGMIGGIISILLLLIFFVLANL